MSRITPCLWFRDQAEEAARFYCSILPDSRIDQVHRSPVDTPGPKVGDVLLVDFTLAGQRVQALNGGMDVDYGMAVSMLFEARDQAELDHVWDSLVEGGRPLECAWLVDRYGLHWQIVSKGFTDVLADPVKGRAAMGALFTMTKVDIAAVERAIAEAVAGEMR